MDTVALVYYAVVCGLLAMAGPSIRGAAARFAAGVFVGLVAAWALPTVRGALGL